MTNVAVAGQTYTFGLSVDSVATPDTFQAAPTIAAGDFVRSINGAAFDNLDNLPTVAPAGGKRIEIVLSIAETIAAGAGGEIYVVGSDTLGAEWKDVAVSVRVFGAEVAEVGDAMTLTADYDLSKTCAQPVAGMVIP